MDIKIRLNEISKHMRTMMDICSNDEVVYFNRMRKTAIEAIDTLEKMEQRINSDKKLLADISLFLEKELEKEPNKQKESMRKTNKNRRRVYRDTGKFKTY